MAQIIEDIIAMDKTAREIVRKAQEKRDQILKTAKAEQKRLLGDGEIKLAKLKLSIAAENDAYKENLVREMNDALSDKKAALDEVYNSNEEKWLSDIIQRLTT